MSCWARWVGVWAWLLGMWAWGTQTCSGSGSQGPRCLPVSSSVTWAPWGWGEGPGRSHSGLQSARRGLVRVAHQHPAPGAQSVPNNPK